MSDLDAVLDGVAGRTSPLDDALDLAAQDERSRLRQTLFTALDQEPDRYARAKQLEAPTGLPAPVIARNLDRVAKTARINELDAALTTVALRARMADPDFAALAHDDVGPLQELLSGFGRAAEATLDAPRAIVSGLPRVSQGTYGTVAAGFGALAQGADALGRAGLLPANPFAEAEQFFLGVARGQGQLAERIAGPTPPNSILAQGIRSGLQSFGQQAPGLVMSMLARNPAAMLQLLTVEAFGQSYQKGREAGLDPLHTLPFAATDALVERMTEGVPASLLVKNVGEGASFLKTFATQLAEELPGEQVATLWQDFNEWVTLHPEKSVGEYLRERPSAAAVTLVATLIGTGANVTLGQSVAGAEVLLQERQQKAAQAQRDAQALGQLLAAGERSKLRERAPQTFSEYVQAAAEEDGQAPTEIYVDARVLAQTLQQEALPPEVVAQLPEALVAGGDVRIPIGVFAARLAATEQGKALIPHLRTSPEAPSAAEAEVFLQQAQEQFQEEARAALESAQVDTEFQASADRVGEQLLGALSTTKRFRPDVNEAYVKGLLQPFYSTLAVRLGITPEEAFARYGLGVQRSAIAGALDQEGQEQTETPEFLAWFSQDAGQVGPFGPIFTEYRGDAQGAIERLKRERTGEAVGALHHPEVGEIDLVWGEEGTGHHDGFGVAKLVQYHPEVLGDLQGILSGMRVRSRSKNRVQLESESHRAGIRLDWDGQAKHWLLTAFEKEAGAHARTDTVRDTAGVTRPAPDPTNSVQQRMADFYGASARKTGPRGQLAFGADITQGPSIITLLENADLSTFIHESGHFFLEVLSHAARQPNAPPQIVDDMNAILAWFGVGQKETALGTVVLTPADLEHGRTLADMAQRFGTPPRALVESWKSKAPRPNTEQGALWAALNGIPEMALYAAEHPDARPGEHRAPGQAPLEVWAAMPLEQKRPYHEQFARGFEAYAFEGQAPSTELQGIFSRFRAWLLNVYKQLKALNVTLSDDVRGVFDRLLATDEQIAQAERTRAFQALFANAKDAGMTEQEFIDYQALGAEATGRAQEELGRRSLRDMRWLANARARVLREMQQDAAEKRKAMRREVEAELRRQPVYAAEAFLRRGELPEAVRTNAERKLLDSFAGRPEKLSLPALREMYGEEPAAPWRYLSTGKFGLAGTDGLHPNTVAELFGFTSGDHLVRELLAAEPFRAAVDALTDQRMLEKYGDLSNPVEIEKAVDAAVHNEARMRFVATELRALEKATSDGKARTVPNAAKAYAELVIARRRVKDVKPAQFREQEARAARGAEQALKKGNLPEAAVEKRNQLVNGYALRAAMRALGEIDSGVRYLQKFDREGVRKGLDTDYLDQIDQLLERFDLRRSVSNAQAAKRESLLRWVEAQREQGIEPAIDEELLAEARRKPYKELTVEEFRGLVDAVRNIEHLARLKHKLLTAKDQREFAAIVADAEQRIHSQAKRDVPVRLETGPLDRVTDEVTSFFSSHRKLSSLVREMDGFEEGGLLWELWIRPMNAAGNFEAVRREQATKHLARLLDPLVRSKTLGDRVRGLRPVITWSRLLTKAYIPEIGASLSHEGRIAIALNMGNETNRTRVLEGEAWTSAQLEAVLDTLTQEDWAFVQGVWDYIDSFWPEIAAKEKRVSGVTPEKVQAAPVVTKFGVLKGGYYPIKYDPHRSTKAEADSLAEITRQAMQGLYTRATTRRGHTKARVETVKRPVRKDLGVIFEHVEQVVHDLAWHEWLIDANRLLRAKPIDSAIRAHYGPERLRQMRETFEAIAAGDIPAKNGWERGVNYARQGATIAGLGWNLTTALLQPLGLTQSMVRIGPAWVGKGLARWFGDAARMENTTKWVYERSDFMRLRGQTLMREISEIRNRVRGKGSKLEASFFYLIQKMQLVADMPTWLGAYEKAMAQFQGDEAKAIALADQAVLDAQGGGQTKDLADIQRGGPLKKLFTNFYSFFNTTYNLTAESFARTDFRRPAEVGLFAVDMLLLYTVPVVLGRMIRNLMRGDDDDEDLLEQILVDHLSYLLGTMVGAREVSGAVQGIANYQGPAGSRIFSESSRFITQAAQGEADEAFWKSLNSAGGILFHYPAGQVQRTAEGVAALTDGQTANPGVLVAGAPK